ncbi:hypothetical protein VCRA2114E123_30061 [Vibrio crassostreae]|nr:hypothetical protein VCRA2114E123_30061 [Vibrio crassostreae]CAK2030273.1 hypothetical protein VCRA2114E122_30061 [Vibrio crassostreae]CAK3575363.1 hypothetical protein VCRA2126O133_30276 [Vibrio crassostreae]
MLHFSLVRRFVQLSLPSKLFFGITIEGLSLNSSYSNYIVLIAKARRI